MEKEEFASFQQLTDNLKKSEKTEQDFYLSFLQDFEHRSLNSVKYQF